MITANVDGGHWEPENELFIEDN